MTAFSKTILGKILGGAAQVVATPLGLGNVAHASLDKVTDSVQNVITGKSRTNVAKDVTSQAEAEAAQKKIAQVGLNINSGIGGTSISGYLNTAPPTAAGLFQTGLYWVQKNIMLIIGVVAIYFIFLKMKKRR